MSLMEQFANPEYFGNLSFGEKMAGTGITALMGMGITFAILIILWVMIAFMTKIIRGFENAGKKKAEAPAAAPAAPAAAAIDDEAAPQAATTGYGALINLLLTLGTALMSFLMILFFIKRDRDDEEEAEQPVMAN